MTLQMGWIESCPYFYAASETGRYVAAQYVEAPIGLLPDYKFINHATHGNNFSSLPVQTHNQALAYVVKVYVDDYISLAIPILQEQLRHVANKIMARVYNIFPVDEDDNIDPILLKKMKILESMWALEKDTMGFMFISMSNSIMLDKTKRDSLLAILHS